MAWTVTKTKPVWGNNRVVVLKCACDAATQTVETGIKNIVGYSLGPASMTTAAINIKANKGAAGTAIAGSLGFSACASTDVFFVTVYGN